MNQKALIVYASHYGSTEQIALTIAQELTRRGLTVDVQAVRQVSSLAGYDRVMLGSAVRYGQWLPEAVNFVSAHQAELNAKPTAFFTVHILNTAADPESEMSRKAYLNPVRPLVKPGAEAFFAGKIDYSQLTVFERMLCKLIKSPAGDLRDWNCISCWAQTVFL